MESDVFDLEKLNKVEQKPTDPDQPPATAHTGDSFDLENFISKYGLRYTKKETSPRADIYHLAECPFNSEHKNGDAKLFSYPNGAIAFKCHHDHCQSYKWQDVRLLFEPNAYDKDEHIQNGWNKYKASKKSAEPTDPAQITNALVSLDDIEETEKEWLIPNYIPKGDITILAGDGGAGKTNIWCSIASAVSNGTKAFFDKTPFDCDYQNNRVLYFSSEDSTETVLKKRLKSNNAVMSNIRTVPLTSDLFEKIKFDSQELEQLIASYDPALVVFDPLQAFIPPDVQMASRNEMRQCMSKLASLGEKYGTSFIIVCHTNKRGGVYGRNRISDSSDIWDISRSVLICGRTEEDNTRYLSHEKSNYCQLQQTALFEINDNQIDFKGFTDKRDADFVHEANQSRQYSAPAKEDTKQLIIQQLRESQHQTMDVAELDVYLKNCGVSGSTLSRAKTELKKDGIIKIYSLGFGNDKKWHIQLANYGGA